MQLEEGAYARIHGLKLTDYQPTSQGDRYAFCRANFELINALAGIYSHGLMVEAHRKVLDYEVAIHALRGEMKLKNTPLDSAGVR
jgi:hypothetical protein